MNDCKMKKNINHPNDYYYRSRYAQHHCISEFPLEDDEIISKFSRLNMSTGVTEYTEDYYENVVKDKEEYDVACNNIKKIKPDIAFDGCQIAVSNENEKIQKNPINVINPPVLPEALPVSAEEQQPLQFYQEAEGKNFIINPKQKFNLIFFFFLISFIFLAELEFIKQFTVEFLNDIIPIENIKTSSLICIPPPPTCPQEHK